jgi:acetyl-CoA acetyltransferase
MIANENAVEEHDWDPLARIVDTHVVVEDSILILTGPIPATNEILEANDMTAADIDVFECNEAFVPVVGAWLQDTEATWDRTNIRDGAIAHGHPLGATGRALMTKVAYQLEQTGGQYGLSTLCIGDGMSVSAIIENV